MKTVLCYGDSLTWGYDPDGPARHAHEDRWPNVLQAGLGVGVNVIAEGLNGRTTAFDDRLGSADRNGAQVLPVALSTPTPGDCEIAASSTPARSPGQRRATASTSMPPTRVRSGGDWSRSCA